MKFTNQLQILFIAGNSVDGKRDLGLLRVDGPSSSANEVDVAALLAAGLDDDRLATAAAITAVTTAAAVHDDQVAALLPGSGRFGGEGDKDEQATEEAEGGEQLVHDWLVDGSFWELLSLGSC